MEITVELIEAISLHMYHSLINIANHNSTEFIERFPMDEFGIIEIDQQLYPGFDGKIMRTIVADNNYELVLEISREDRIWLQTIKL